MKTRPQETNCLAWVVAERERGGRERQTDRRAERERQRDRDRDRDHIKKFGCKKPRLKSNIFMVSTKDLALTVSKLVR